MSSDSSERRKGPRRSGVGRRIAGDRRKEERAILPGWMPRQGPRRTEKRRSLPDRRSNAN
ncbi:MAG TPA: hypothetical protein VEO02_01290 [Thermoanaerobaculia bacterium]|nr:hypothetical protein [Thermoanaerobaculia bacterium]